MSHPPSAASLELHKSLLEQRQQPQMDRLDAFLDDEIQHNAKEPWCKLDRTDRMKKLIEYTDRFRQQTPGFTEEDATHMIAFFKDGLDAKKWGRAKDVVYALDTGEVQDVVLARWNSTLRRMQWCPPDKRVGPCRKRTPPSSSKRLALLPSLPTRPLQPKDNPVLFRTSSLLEPDPDAAKWNP
jgi:hypothetical protein